VRTSRNWIIVVTLALLAVGLVMIYSSSAVKAEIDSGDAGSTMRKQLVWVGLGLLIAVLTFDRDYRRLQRFAPWIYWGMIVLLIAVLVPGIGGRFNGASRWLRLPGGLTFQVSDLAKLSVILSVSCFAVKRKERMSSLRHGTLPGLALILLPCALIYKEPDLGTAIVISAIGLTLLVLAGMRTRYVLPVALLVPIAIVVAYSMFPHVRTRIDGFLDPENPSDPTTYQVRQGLIAMGSGGWTGKGLGAGEMKLFGVPEAGSDFILAVIGEEAGLLGTWIVLFCFGAYVYHGWRIAMNAGDTLGCLLAFGATALVGVQAIVNVGVVSASLPNKGISLPFISAGGSSVLFMILTTAMLLSVANTTLREAAPGRIDSA